MPPVVEATDIVVPGLYRRFVRCPACRTYLMDPMDMPDYGGRLPGLLAPDPYIEVGAGIDFIGMLLSAVPASKRASARLVDVGCGCGFSVHFWRSFGRDGLGVEPSALGFAGEERLGIPIVHGVAGAAPELDGRRFDVVLSSEVIEHVPAPADLLRILASLRAPGGYVILSTPDPAVLDEAAGSDLDAWEALSPGFHTCVLSPVALRRLCMECGLPAVRIERSGAHLVCVAGEDVDDAAPDRAEARREYGDYLRREVEKGSPFPSVRDGLAFRLFQYLLNIAGWAEAKVVRDRIRNSFRQRYAEDVTDPSICRRRAEAIPGPEEIGRHVPWFFLELHHALGILEVAGGGSPDLARDHFQFVADAARRLIQLDPTFTPRAESYAYNAMYQLATIALSGGSASELEAFLDLESDWSRTGLAFAPGREILAIAASALYRGHEFSGRHDSARLEEKRHDRLLCRALNVPRFAPDVLAASVRADAAAAAEREGLWQAATWSLLARGLLRLDGDRLPAAAVASFDGALDLLESLRPLGLDPTFIGHLTDAVRRERARALAGSPESGSSMYARRDLARGLASRLLRRVLRRPGRRS